MPTKKKKKTTDALNILHRRYVKDRPGMTAMLEEERSNAEIARNIFMLREKAGLTQAKLSKLVGNPGRS